MTHPIPPGTRDILPDEMRELRRLSVALIEAFERFGYGEVSTPTIEYEEVLARGGESGAPVAYRFFDERGELLAMRSDMTIPIARLIANRYAGAEPPFRLCYLATAYRAVRPQRGQMREFTQAGVELVGVPAPQGTVEVIEVLSAALDAAGLSRAVIGLGDADLYRQLLDELGVEAGASERLLACLAAHDHVGLEAEVARLDLGAGERETLVRLPTLRGGPEVLDSARDLGGAATARASERLAATYDGLRARGGADRVNLDLGLLRDLGYYTGAILEVYDPALGHVLGGGGRYDGLMARFGWPLPAVGFALHLERLHVAQAEEERFAATAGDGPARGPERGS
ncbi:MAG: ATP phosphoribosyltransferase regulatory subunit [Solirubrobacterales bacterium]|nr:ATP phosphoribosyltransferase regulatory subunit [Solirubrobacterales bacterium]